MSKGLEALERLAYENACCRCQYWGKEGCSLWSQNKDSCVWLVIKKELKALEIIKDFVWIERGEIRIGVCGDIETFLMENDFESKEKYDLLKEVLV